MTPGEIITAVGAGLPPEVRCEADHHGVVLDVPPGDWLAALAFARADLDCDFFDWLTAVDGPARLLRRGARLLAGGRHHVLVRTLLPVPRRNSPTATGIYRGAAWHERETHEMFGVGFDGIRTWRRCCPRRVRRPPLRKDFVLAARAAKEWPGAKEPGERDVAGAAAPPAAAGRARGWQPS